MVAFSLAACAKKEEQPKADSCPQVRVVLVTNNQTLLETTDENRYRYLREGVFGNQGDQFRFCH